MTQKGKVNLEESGKKKVKQVKDIKKIIEVAGLIQR